MRTSADTNNVSIGYIAEEEWAVTPANPTLQAIRLTAESLGHAKETVESQEIRADRNVSDLIQVGVSANGGFDFELSYGAFNPFILAFLFADPVVINLAGVTATINAAASTVAGTAGDFDDVPIGGAVKIAGATAPTNNGIKLVIAKSVNGGTLTFSAGAFTADQVGASLTLTGTVAKNGTTRSSFTMERRIITTDGHDHYHSFLGMIPDTLALTFESKTIVKGSFGFMGSRGYASDDSLSDGTTGTRAAQILTVDALPTADDTVTIGALTYTFVASPDEEYEVAIGSDAEEALDNLVDEINGDGLSPMHPDVTAAKTTASTMTVTAILAGTAAHTLATTETFTDGLSIWTGAVLAGGVEPVLYTPVSTNKILNATSNVGTFLLNDTASQECMKTLTLAGANGLRGKDCIGTLGNFDIGTGTFGMTGTLTAHFLNNDLYESFLAHTPIALSWQVADEAGNTYVFHLPMIQLRTGAVPAEGLNQDLRSTHEFTAFLDPDCGCTMALSYFPAA